MRLDEKRQPAPIDIMTSQQDTRIAGCYRSVTIQRLNYYLCCENLSKVRSIVNYHLRWSAIYTLAKRHKSSSQQIIQKFSKNLVVTKEGAGLAAFLDPKEISGFQKCFLTTDPTLPELIINRLKVKPK